MSSVIYWLFLASGAAGLIYEVVWMRMLLRILGTTVFAYTVVLSAFMLGLALGAWWFGRRIDRGGRPLRVYAVLECGIALWAMALPFLLDVLLRVFALASRTFSDAPIVVDAIRCFLAFAALLVPTVLMGGTLPVLTKFVTDVREDLGQRVAQLYAVNTVGAIAGAGAAGFVLIGKIGELRTSLVAIALNLMAAGVAALLARVPGTQRQAQQEPSLLDAQRDAPSASRLHDRLLLLVIALTGFTMLAYEVLWTRTGTLILSNSTYSFSIMLLSFLTGIAAGSAIMAAAFRHWRPGWKTRWGVLALLQLLIGIVAILSFGSTVPVVAKVYPLWNKLGGPLVGWIPGPVPAVFLLMAPLTLLSGASFPIAAGLYTRDLGRVGVGVGAVYLCNTVGAALGSAVAGFVLLPKLGISGSFLVCTGISVLSALALVVALPGRAPWVKLRWAAGGALVAVLCVTGVASQTGGLQVPRTLLMKRLKRYYRGNLFYREDINGIVSVWINPLEEDPWLNDKRLYIDGQPMASAYRYAMIYERLQAHYPLLLHPDPQDVLVICLGTGTTLGSVGQYPVSHMDCVELSRSVVAAGVCFEEETHGILNDPRLAVHVGDGRNYLLSTSRSYDVITAEPMHPHLAGTVNLYTREYFALVRDRLRPGGICSHWIPVHKMRPREVKSAVAAFREVFPHTMLFLETADAIVIGSQEPLTIDAARWRELLGDKRIGADLEEVGLSTLPQLLATYMMDTPSMDRYVRDVAPVTDDLPTLEFFGSHAAATQQRPENIRQIIEHRDELGDLLAHMSGELTPQEAEELEKLYPLEADYLRAYAEYAAENYRAAAKGFADVLREAPDDRRAEISLRGVEQSMARHTSTGLSTPLSSGRQ